MMRYLLFSLILPCTAPASGGASQEAEFADVEKRLLELRAIEDDLRHANVDRLRAAAIAGLERMNSHHREGTATCKEFLTFYKARLQVLVGRYDEAHDGLLQVAESQALMPEALFALREVGYRTNRGKKADDCLRLLGKALPCSIVGRLHDAAARPFSIEEPLIPCLDSEKSVRIGDLFFEQNLYQQASDAYREAIYCSGTYSPLSSASVNRGNHAWLSPASAPLWLKVAQAEYHLGNRTTCANFVAKVVVFGGENHKEAALKLLADSCRSRPSRPTSSKPGSGKLSIIARYYAEMNMHPRAIHLLKDYAGVVGPDAKALEAKYSKEWLDLLEHYCAGVQGPCTLFGQDVSSKENRLKIVIPPPCSKEALEEVAKAVKELK